MLIWWKLGLGLALGLGLGLCSFDEYYARLMKIRVRVESRVRVYANVWWKLGLG